MSSTTGRKILITWDSIEIAAREKTVTLNGEPLDVSDDRSDGWRELLTGAETGERSVNISFSGLTKSSDLRLKNNTSASATVTFPGLQGDMTGTFVLTGYTDTGSYNEAIEFSAELHSTGVVTIAADSGGD